jgi:hypothetical protein
MRASILVFVGELVFGVVNAGSPARPGADPIELDAAPPIELVSAGCGWGWRRHYWRDR